MNQSAIGKTVKVNKVEKVSYSRGIEEIVRVNDGGLLNFFYPDFIIKDKIFFNQGDKVIYVGEKKANIKEYLRKNTYQFIDTVGVPVDLDFTDRLELLDFVCGKWRYERKKIYQDNDIEYLLWIDETVFLTYIKQFWLSGKNSLANMDDAIAATTIFEAIVKRKKGLPTIIKLIEQHNKDYLEFIILSFLEKTYFKKQTYGFRGEYYQSALKIIRQRFSPEILTAVLARYRKMKKSKKMKLFWLFTLLCHQRVTS